MLYNFLIKIYLDRAKYVKFSKYIEIKLDPIYKYIFSAIDRYYSEHDANLTTESLKGLVDSENPTMRENVKGSISDILNSINSLELNAGAESGIIANLVRQDFASKIGTSALSVMEDPTQEFDEIQEMLDECDAVLTGSSQDDTFYDPDIEELLEETDADHGIPWWSEELTLTLGTIQGGDLGCVYAPVNAGKTAFCMTTIFHTMKKIPDDRCVMYINNEQGKRRMYMRALQSYFKMTREQVLANKTRVIDEWNRVRHKFKLFDQSNITMYTVHQLIKQYRPAFTIIDQVSKIKIRGEHRDDIAQQLRWSGLREMCKDYDTHILGVHQAGNIHNSIKWLKMSDLHGSNVGIQGELDYMIGINFDEGDPNKENERYMSFPKCKNTGRETDRYTALIQKEISRYEI